ncbi:hypothetical protein COR50_06120 [Chitinophaga caeni]|uniref:Uncharacterized protein n=1 Tax=Chitinophaga caeni TaxID=2029983 RepID=A0A291QS85_9BACT|nr:hypothetical protein [Chitinophaga caeni]ATL46785.1 hypothetical protein COR50_06120 [Chitinophaga caeni]
MRTFLALLAVIGVITLLHAKKDKVLGIQSDNALEKLEPFQQTPQNLKNLPNPGFDEAMVMVPDSVYQASRLDPGHYSGHYHVLYVKNSEEEKSNIIKSHLVALTATPKTNIHRKTEAPSRSN